MANTRALEAGKAVIRGSLDTAAIDRSLRALQSKFAAFGAKLRNIGMAFTAAGTAITAPIAAALKTFAESGDALNKMHDRTGVSVEALSELAYAFGQSGSSAEGLEKALRGMQKSILNLKEGSKSSVDAFRAIGLSMADLKDLSPEDQFKLMANKLSAVEDPTMRAALAMRLFGKSGAELLPVLGYVDALSEEARRLGVTMTAEDAQAATDFGDALDRLKQQMLAIVRQIGAAVAGPLTNFLKYTQAIMRSVIDWVSANRQLFFVIAAVGAGLLAAGTAIITIGGAFSLVAWAAGGLATALGAIGSAIGLILSPIGLIAVAIAGGTAAFLKFTQTGQNMTSQLVGYFQNLWGIFSETFSAIKAALAGGDTQAAANVMWAGLEVAWLEGTAKIREITRTMYGWLLKVWTNSTSGLRSIWNGTTQFFADSLDVAGAAIVKSWNATIAMLQKTWLRVKGLFGADVQGEIDKINSELASTNAAIDNNTTSQIGARDAAAQKAAADAERERQRRMAEIDSNTDDALNAARERQRAAREAFSAAKDAAIAAGDAAAAQVTAASDMAEGSLGDGGGGSRAAASLFDARYASQVFGGGSVQKDQLAVQKQMLAEQKRTRQQLEAAGVPVIP